MNLPKEIVDLIFEFRDGNKKDNCDKVIRQFTKVYTEYLTDLEERCMPYLTPEKWDYVKSIIPSIVDLQFEDCIINNRAIKHKLLLQEYYSETHLREEQGKEFFIYFKNGLRNTRYSYFTEIDIFKI